MRKIYLFSLLALSTLSLPAQSKLDLSARMLMQNYEQMRLGANPKLFDSRLSVGASRSATDVPEVGVIVRLNPGYSAEDACFDPSVTVTADLGTMAVVSVPVTMLEQLAGCEAVRTVSAGNVQQSQMYFARSSGNADAVQSGSDGLPMAYTGKGVVVGMMDQGMDPNHINFTERDDVSVSRVKAVYAFNGSNGTPTQSCTTPDDIKNFKTDLTSATHGTHVMGIAAGSYNGEGTYGLSGKTYTNSPIPFYGVATDADIVMSGGLLYDANIVAGVKKVMDYAEDHGQPAVCNLSLGGVLGPHDGSDALSEALALQGERGIICVSAGNDGDTECAMNITGGGLGSSTTNNAVGFSYGTTASSPYTAQFWSSDSDPFTKFEFVIYSTATNAVVYSMEVPANSVNGVAIGGTDMGSNYTKNDNFSSAFTSSSYAVFWSDVSEDNNRYYVQMQFIMNRGSSSDLSLMPAVRVTRKSKTQSVYGYINTPTNHPTATFVRESYNVTGLNWTYTKVSTNGSISDMATGRNIIPVGAYTSSQWFTVQSGSQYSYNGSTSAGTICNFSSYGTNPVTGENLPLVCAPGSAIVSSISNHYTGSTDVCATAGGNNRSNIWGPMQGTSMSCPFVTGTIGLWLQADPTLTVSRVREIISSTSTPYTGTDSDLKIKWGAGRLDALKGIQEVISTAAIGTVWADEAQRLVITSTAGGYDVFVADGRDIAVTLYDLQGRPVAKSRGTDGMANLTVGRITPGVYILEARGDGYRFSRKVTR